MSAKHTPGPWHISETDNTEILTAEGRVQVMICKMGEGDLDQHLPDARLIAAAPDLLDALQAMLALHRGGGEPSAKARAAIRKATGE